MIYSPWLGNDNLAFSQILSLLLVCFVLVAGGQSSILKRTSDMFEAKSKPVHCCLNGLANASPKIS